MNSRRPVPASSISARSTWTWPAWRSTGDKPAKLDATVTVADGQTLKHTGELALAQGTLAGTLESTGLRPRTAAWWPRALRSQFGDTGINAELHYKMAWSQPVFQFTLEKSRLELSPVCVATREPIVLPATPAAAERPANAERRAARAESAARGDNAGDGRGRGLRVTRRAADLEGDKLPLVRAEKLVLEDISLDLARQNFEAGQVSLIETADRRHARLSRRHSRMQPASGRWSPPGRRRAPARPAAPAAPAAQRREWPSNGPAPPAWAGRVRLRQGSPSERDAPSLADHAPAEANRGRAGHPSVSAISA